MHITPLPKTPKIPTNNILADGGALLVRALFDSLTETNNKINSIITEIERIKKEGSIPE